MRTRAAFLLAVLGLALLAGACGGTAGEGDTYGESTVVQERAVVGVQSTAGYDEGRPLGVSW